jgi:hypothetical protein
MAGTVLIKRVTGASGSQTLNDVTSGTTRLNTADVVADGTNNPTAIPASGSNYSFWSCERLVCSVAPATEINNIRFYGPASNTLGTGVDCNVSTVAGTNGTTTTNYTQASGTAGLTGLEMGANYGHSITSPVSVFGYTAAAPLTVTGTFITGTDTAANTASGSFADWVILQLKVGSTASAGVTAAQTMTYIYDEF